MSAGSGSRASGPLRVKKEEVVKIADCAERSSSVDITGCGGIVVGIMEFWLVFRLVGDGVERIISPQESENWGNKQLVTE